MTRHEKDRISVRVSLMGLKSYMKCFEDDPKFPAETFIKLVEDNLKWLKRSIKENETSKG